MPRQHRVVAAQNCVILHIFSIVTVQEDAMSIIRLIYIKVDPSETENAVRIWKTQCASLMIQQKGCLSEKPDSQG